MDRDDEKPYSYGMRFLRPFLSRLLFSASMTALLTGASLVLFGGTDRTLTLWLFRMGALTPIAFVGSLLLGPVCSAVIAFLLPRRGPSHHE